MSKPIPPAPDDWNKTIADLFAEIDRGERTCVGSPEIDWAREYERSLIPPAMRFPKKGDVYEAQSDMTVHYMTSWAAPFTGGGEGLLRKGDQVLVDSELSDSYAVGTYAVAVDYEALEKRFVPAADRSEPKYGGFYFFFKTVDLNQKFKLVQEESSPI